MCHVQNVYILPGAYHPGGHESKGPLFCLQGNSEVIREIFEINMIWGISNIEGQEDMDMTRMATTTGYRR